jgi:hypothetical protein
MEKEGEERFMIKCMGKLMKIKKPHKSEALK